MLDSLFLLVLNLYQYCHDHDHDDDHHHHDNVDVDDYDDVEDLIPPEPVLVELSKAVDDDGNRQREDEDAREGAEATNKFP